MVSTGNLAVPAAGKLLNLSNRLHPMLVASENLSDDRLLHDFVLSQSQDAFAVLVRRHGPMVWGVCRRTAGHTHDAEDAFQATFAILARKAPSIRRQRAIGAWLHQVARRAALRARATTIRRGTVMDTFAMDVQADLSIDESASDRGEILDDEIGRLPESLRLPVVLCYLQGLTNREAGERLGCPEGTIVSRLARARGLLRQRLVRRGLVIGSTAAVSTLLNQTGMATPLLPSLLSPATQCGLLNATHDAVTGAILSKGAARLAEETIAELARRVLLLRLGLLLAGLCCLGAIFGMLNYAGTLGRGTDADAAPLDRSLSGGAEQRPNPVAVPAALLDGVWEGEDLEFIGGSDPADHDRLSRNVRWVVAAGSVHVKWQNDALLAARYAADSASLSGPIDYTIDSGGQAVPTVLPGVFEIRDGTLEVCSGEAGGTRPKSITTGLVPSPPDDAVTIRAGLAGYARLRRLDRSLQEEELLGKWVLVSWETGGAALPRDPQEREAALFEDDHRYVMHHVDGDNVRVFGGKFMLDPAKPERFMTMQPEGQERFLCLYEIKDDTLWLCMAAPGNPRPLMFRTTPTDQANLSFVFRRSKGPP